jgi:hypothetical protein
VVHFMGPGALTKIGVVTLLIELFDVNQS